MAGKPDSKIKLLAIKNILEQYSDDTHVLSAQNIAEYLLRDYGIECERKSVYHDIEVLKDMQYDLIRTHGGYHIGARLFEPAEIRLLTDAVQTAGFISRKKTQQMLDKIYTLVSVYQAKNMRSRCFFTDRVKSTNEKLFYHIDALDNAIKNERKVKIVYVKRKMGEQFATCWEKKEYILSPYALIWSNDHYYLAANYEKYDNLMNIRIDRIESVEITENHVRDVSQVSEYKGQFNAADYVAKSFNMFSGTSETVELQCCDEMLEAILDRFGDNTHIRKSNENGFRIVIEAPVNEGLVSYIMQFGDKIRVVRPEKLQNMITERAKSILCAYETP